jgi:hypothetical protein
MEQQQLDHHHQQQQQQQQLEHQHEQQHEQQQQLEQQQQQQQQMSEQQQQQLEHPPPPPPPSSAPLLSNATLSSLSSELGSTTTLLTPGGPPSVPLLPTVTVPLPQVMEPVSHFYSNPPATLSAPLSTHPNLPHQQHQPQQQPPQHLQQMHQQHQQHQPPPPQLPPPTQIPPHLVQPPMDPPPMQHFPAAGSTQQPTGQLYFETLASLELFLDSYAKQYGFAWSIANSKRSKIPKDQLPNVQSSKATCNKVEVEPDSDYINAVTYKVICCERAGKRRDREKEREKHAERERDNAANAALAAANAAGGSQDANKMSLPPLSHPDPPFHQITPVNRNTTSKKCGCPAQVNIRYSPIKRLWKINKIQLEHNHPLGEGRAKEHIIRRDRVLPDMSVEDPLETEAARLNRKRKKEFEDQNESSESSEYPPAKQQVTEDSLNKDMSGITA